MDNLWRERRRAAADERRHWAEIAEARIEAIVEAAVLRRVAELKARGEFVRQAEWQAAARTTGKPKIVRPVS